MTDPRLEAHTRNTFRRLEAKLVQDGRYDRANQIWLHFERTCKRVSLDKTPREIIRCLGVQMRLSGEFVAASMIESYERYM